MRPVIGLFFVRARVAKIGRAAPHAISVQQARRIPAQRFQDGRAVAQIDMAQYFPLQIKLKERIGARRGDPQRIALIQNIVNASAGGVADFAQDIPLRVIAHDA